MALREINAPDLIRHLRQASGLPITADNRIDEPLLAALTRRAASILCPCSRATVATATVESLEHLVAEPEGLRDGVEAAIEGAIVFGDLLELSQVTIDDPNVKGTWIFTAPPGFVARGNGTILLFGVARDEISPLPAELTERIIYNHYGRIIRVNPDEELPVKLTGLGLLQHSEEAWLKAPQELSASAFIEKMEGRTVSGPPSGEMRELQILGPDRDVKYYRGRWVQPKNETGCFVARRPQEYGAALWGLAQLVDGHATRFLDFPTKATRWRGCDEAWHCQMAIDARRGTPQRYRVRPATNGVYLDFFSPIPGWAERRLAVVGESSPPSKCLFSYHVEQRDLVSEEDFLKKRLWLAREDDAKSGGG
jgi:hypothetical protein